MTPFLDPTPTADPSPSSTPTPTDPATTAPSTSASPTPTPSPPPTVTSCGSAPDSPCYTAPSGFDPLHSVVVLGLGLALLLLAAIFAAQLRRP